MDFTILNQRKRKTCSMQTGLGMDCSNETSHSRTWLTLWLHCAQLKFASPPKHVPWSKTRSIANNAVEVHNAGMEVTVKYFEKTGKINTQEALITARKRTEELRINQIVVASTHGYTGLEAARVFKGTNVRIIVVSLNKTAWRRFCSTDKATWSPVAFVKTKTLLHLK